MITNIQPNNLSSIALEQAVLSAFNKACLDRQVIDFNTYNRIEKSINMLDNASKKGRKKEVQS